MCLGASSCQRWSVWPRAGKGFLGPAASQLLSERIGVTAGQGGLRRVGRRVGAGWAEPYALPPVSTNSFSSDPRGRGIGSQAASSP